ncbi:hypothetical protein [Mammaliicoccus sp. H-M32]|uniref:hypothetical protein n=1 Tax=Mammaliicoccus TaxID=2803850 RepID=UPI001EFB54A8|nr:hypothetical protein [Mammaliicoccus sp. H-M32]
MTVWNTLFNDEQYNDISNKIDDLIKETRLMVKRQFKPDFIANEQRPKAIALQNELKEYAQNRMSKIQTELEGIEQRYTYKNHDNPQLELIRRQDLQARLSLLDSNDLINEINNANLEDISVFEVGIYQNMIDEKMSDSDKAKVDERFTEIKDKALNPFKYDEDYKQKEQDYLVLENSGMNHTGVSVVKDDDGQVSIKSVTELVDSEIK